MSFGFLAPYLGFELCCFVMDFGGVVEAIGGDKVSQVTSEQTLGMSSFPSDLVWGDRGASDDDGGPGVGGTAPAVAVAAAVNLHAGPINSGRSDAMPSMCL